VDTSLLPRLLSFLLLLQEVLQAQQLPGEKREVKDDKDNIAEDSDSTEVLNTRPRITSSLDKVNVNVGDLIQIEFTTFDGDGCAISVAAASMLTEYIEGKTIQDLKLITPGDIYGMLGVQIGPARVNCALLAYKALSDSLEKYEPNTK